MFVELHILQNFAPSNLNRDDTGAPKDCEFGGFRRARISSQCLKRAVRTSFKDDKLLDVDALAVRTKRLVDALAARFQTAGKDDSEGRRVAETALAGIGLSIKDGKTQYLVFLGEEEIAGVARLCLENWETLLGAVPAAVEGKTAKLAKKGQKDAIPKELSSALQTVLNGGRAADLALFGRMLADLPAKNVDAAAQVAHAISTNKVGVEFDFYTAVDDLKPNDTAGADMLGTIEFNSACFYRYSNVDTAQLARNLDGDTELARSALRAFLRASINAVPTGKQNSMAAHNPPSLVFAVVRESAPLQNLANAFIKPVTPSHDGDLVENSARCLDRHRKALTGMYGDGRFVGGWLATMIDEPFENLSSPGSVDALVDGVVSIVSFTEVPR